MNPSHDPGIWVGALLTLFVFSFLYKDNPFYKFAEHLFVGVSAGVLLRAAILGHWYAKELAFWGVALVFVGFFAATTRATWRSALRRRTARPAPG